jgi:signal transduction histidine kinase
VRLRWLVAGVVAMGLGWPGAGSSIAVAEGAEDAATPAEVVAEVRAAAALLAEQGQAGLAALQDRHGRFVFKDSYVFASDCGKGVLLAHPIQPERNGQPIAAGPAYGGLSAADRAKAQCAVGTTSGGGWWAYPFPRPGTAEPSRKVTYFLPVPGTNWIVGAGVYDETDTIEALTRISDAAQ